MIKSYIFASMYTLIGVTGWGAYSTINNENSAPLTAISQITASASTDNEKNNAPLSNTLYRWKDHNGVWQYGEAPVTDANMEDYEKELALLRRLPREVLPTQSLVPAEEDDSIFAMLPSFSDLAALMNLADGSMDLNLPAGMDPSKADQIEKILQDTENLKEVMNNRQELMDQIR